jgi:two-component system sensor histidine kinase BaeS
VRPRVRLRLRLAIVTVLVTLPMVGLLVWLDARARQRAAEEELAKLVLGRIDIPGERARCEASPSTWPPFPRDSGPRGDGPRGDGPRGDGLPPPRGDGPPPPMRGGPGDDAARHGGHRLPAQLSVLAAPPAELTTALAPGEFASRSSTWNDLNAVIVVRTPWTDGPCAYVLARGTKERWLGAILPETRVWLLPLVYVLTVVLFAIGPIISRLRRLTREVERSALAGYAAPVAVAGSDEIGDLARAFDAAAQEVRLQLSEKDRREEALRRFLADTTHDVMIPLTVLKGHLTTLHERLGAAGASDAVMVAAMDEAHYIGALLHNLSAAAKLDAAEPLLHESDVDLSALVARVMSRHQPIAAQHQVSIASAVPDEPLVVRADVTLVEQAASNLVYNAIRHNRPGGHVAVILEAGARGFTLRVVDDGPGIPAAELAHIAERGFRGNDARTRTPDGQGLGLWIVQKVALLHGWSVRFESGPGGEGLEALIEAALPSEPETANRQQATGNRQ